MQAGRLVQTIFDQNPEAITPVVADRRAGPGAVHEKTLDLVAEQFHLLCSNREPVVRPGADLPWIDRMRRSVCRGGIGCAGGRDGGKRRHCRRHRRSLVG